MLKAFRIAMVYILGSFTLNFSWADEIHDLLLEQCRQFDEYRYREQERFDRFLEERDEMYDLVMENDHRCREIEHELIKLKPRNSEELEIQLTLLLKVKIERLRPMAKYEAKYGEIPFFSACGPPILGDFSRAIKTRNIDFLATCVARDIVFGSNVRFQKYNDGTGLLEYAGDIKFNNGVLLLKIAGDPTPVYIRDKQ